MNIQGLMKQALQMQKDMANIENELKEKSYEKTIGGGVIKATVSGALQITDLQIDEGLLKEDKTELQDMIMVVINEALTEASTEKEKAMNELTAGIKMPGGF